MDELFLARPSIEYLPQIRAYRAEFADCLDWMHGTGGLMHIADAEEWLRHVALCEREETVPDGKAPSSQFLFVRRSDAKVVGMLNVRHRPDGPPATWGGHIGFSVCPSERRKGYATRMLRAALPYCKSLGLERVLLTAGDENVGSVKAILANGGKLEGHVLSPKHQIMVGQYWIGLRDDNDEINSIQEGTFMGAREERNKQFVAEFYDLIINQKDYERAKAYMGPRYKQHNPLVKDNPEGLREFIEFLKTNAPEAHSEIIQSFADGDYVILHVHSVRQPGTRGRAIIEIFRLEDGLVDEHWDVIQEIPETSANPNGMF